MVYKKFDNNSYILYSPNKSNTHTKLISNNNIKYGYIKHNYILTNVCAVIKTFFDVETK